MPKVIAEIEQWDWVDQVDYIEEWTPRLQLLDVIRGYAREGRLNSEQQSLYVDLEARVSQHKTLLKELRRS